MTQRLDDQLTISFLVLPFSLFLPWHPACSGAGPLADPFQGPRELGRNRRALPCIRPRIVIAGSRPMPSTPELANSAFATPTVEWRRTFSEMAPLAGPWRELEASVQARSVLATFDYNATWYHHNEGALGGDPLIGVARHGSDVVGIAPLVSRSPARRARAAGLHRIRRPQGVRQRVSSSRIVTRKRPPSSSIPWSGRRSSTSSASTTSTSRPIVMPRCGKRRSGII